jgi:hypothetical protein
VYVYIVGCCKPVKLLGMSLAQTPGWRVMLSSQLVGKPLFVSPFAPLKFYHQSWMAGQLWIGRVGEPSQRWYLGTDSPCCWGPSVGTMANEWSLALPTSLGALHVLSGQGTHILGSRINVHQIQLSLMHWRSFWRFLFSRVVVLKKGE